MKEKKRLINEYGENGSNCSERKQPNTCFVNFMEILLFAYSFFALLSFFPNRGRNRFQRENNYNNPIFGI